MSFTYAPGSQMESMDLICTPNAEGYMGSYEQRAFMYHLGMASKCAAEIGAYCGLSSVLVGMGMKNTGRYYCIDNFEATNKELNHENTFAKWQAAIQQHGLEFTCVPIKGWSHDLAVYAQVPGNLDFVYIDGDHETESVLLDALMYRSKVRPNGLLLFHDTPWPKVKLAVEALLKMEMMTLVRVIHDSTVCRVTDYQSTEARELLATLLASRGKTASPA
jgi:predicted O-methyltransferase YrrM